MPVVSVLLCILHKYMTNSQNNPSSPDTIIVGDLDQMVTLLTAWHSDKVAILKGLLAMPACEILVGDDTVSLKGDTLEAFRLGVSMSLHELGTLPFTPEFSEENGNSTKIVDNSPSFLQ